MAPNRPYDDDDELTRYVLNYFPHLLTHRERLVLHLATMRAKKLTAARVESWLTPEIAAALEDEGPEGFRRRTRDQVLKEHADSIYVNRCTMCRRVVATPKARQCLWCGHDWHKTPPPRGGHP